MKEKKTRAIYFISMCCFVFFLQRRGEKKHIFAFWKMLMKEEKTYLVLNIMIISAFLEILERLR